MGTGVTPAPPSAAVPLSETGVLGDFWGHIKGAKYRFALPIGTWCLQHQAPVPDVL